MGNVEAGDQQVAFAAPRPASLPDPLGRLAAFLDGFPAEPCSLALASATRGGDLLLTQYAAASAEMEARRRTAELAFPGLVTASQAIGRTQCGALGFARQLPRYPDFGLSIETSERAISSGQALHGRIAGSGGVRVHLLLVDDEGKVQLIDRFLDAPEGRFAVPVVLTGPPKSPTQLLLALSRPAGGLATLDAMRPTPADAFFARLGEEAVRRNLDLDFAIAAFTVEPQR